MASPALSVLITGKSDLNKIFAQSNAQMSAFAKHAQATQTQISKITQAGRTGFDHLNKSILGLVRNTWELFKNVSRIVDPLGIITGGATIAGLVALEAKFASLGQTNTNAARGLNMSVTQLTRWQGAAKAAGMSADDMASNIANLEKARTDIRFGRNNQEAAAANQLLGGGWQSKYTTDNSLLMAISARVSKLHGPNLAAALDQAGSAFNLDPSTINMLQRGPQWVQQHLNLASRHGAMTTGQAGALDNLQQSLSGLEQSLDGIGNTVSADVAPGFTKIADATSKWIDANRKLISQDIQAVIAGIGGKVTAVVSALGGWKSSIEIVLGLMAASKLAPIVTAFSTMATAINSMSTGLIALPGLFPAIAAAITGAGLADMFLHSSTSATDTMSGPPVAGSGTPITSKQAGANMSAIEGHYRSVYGASGAAAIMGNAFAESGGNPGAVGPGGSYGLFQLNNAQQALFKQVMGRSAVGSSANDQMGFMDWQLAHNYKGLDSQLRDPAASAGMKTGQFMTGYERPADQSEQAIAKRALYGNEYFNGMGSDPHVVVDVNINHNGSVTTRQRQSSPGVTANVKTVTAMTTGG